MQTLEELEVWKQARVYRKLVSEVCDVIPPYENFLLNKQILNASRSISANIAEGYGRYNFQENIQFLRIARGSLYEVFDHLTCAFDEGYINKEKYRETKEAQYTLARLLNGYIKYLQNRKLSAE